MIKKIRKVYRILTLDCSNVSGMFKSKCFKDQLKRTGFSDMVFQVFENNKLSDQFPF